MRVQNPSAKLGVTDGSGIAGPNVVDTLRLAGTSLALGFLVLAYFVGVGPMMETMYAYGMWPRPGIEAVQNAMTRGSGFESMLCHEGSNGWEYICEGVSRGAQKQPIRHKYGVMGGPFGAVRSATSLPLDQPVPPREQFVAEHHRQVANEQKRLAATLDLNRAREDQLKALPGVDEQLARRIVLRVIHKRFTTVDDLLTVEGVDRKLLERIRPLVRVDK